MSTGPTRSFGCRKKNSAWILHASLALTFASLSGTVNLMRRPTLILRRCILLLSFVLLPKSSRCISSCSVSFFLVFLSLFYKTHGQMSATYRIYWQNFFKATCAREKGISQQGLSKIFAAGPCLGYLGLSTASGQDLCYRTFLYGPWRHLGSLSLAPVT